MQPSSTRLRRYAAVAGTVILATGAVPFVIGSDDSLVIQEVAVLGNTVQITVANLGTETLSGTVVVKVSVLDRVMAGQAPVTVAGGHKAFVQMQMPALVDGVVESRVVLDDGPPF